MTRYMEQVVEHFRYQLRRSPRTGVEIYGGQQRGVVLRYRPVKTEAQQRAWYRLLVRLPFSRCIFIRETHG